MVSNRMTFTILCRDLVLWFCLWMHFLDFHERSHLEPVIERQYTDTIYFFDNQSDVDEFVSSNPSRKNQKVCCLDSYIGLKCCVH